MPGHTARKDTSYSTSWDMGEKGVGRSDTPTTIWFQIRQTGVEQICRSEWSLPSLREPPFKIVCRRNFPLLTAPFLSLVGKGMLGTVARARRQPSPAETAGGAFGTHTCTTQLPGIEVFLSYSWSGSKPFEEQGEAALPAQTKASTVACFFSRELINKKNK